MRPPTARQLVAYFLLPWLVMVFAGAVGAVVFAVAWALVFREALPPPVFVLAALLAGSFVAWFAAAIGWPIWRDALKVDEIPALFARLDLVELRADEIEISIDQQTRRQARLAADQVETPRPEAVDLEAAAALERLADDDTLVPCSSWVDYGEQRIRCQLQAGHAGDHSSQSPTNPAVVFSW